MARVVRPGGRVVVLEITTPTRAPLSHLLRAVVRSHRARARPPRGRARRALARDAAAAAATTIAEAYTYLPNSVKRFPGPAALAAELERAGLSEIGYVLTAGGIVAIHAGTVARRAGDA